MKTGAARHAGRDVDDLSIPNTKNGKAKIANLWERAQPLCPPVGPKSITATQTERGTQTAHRLLGRAPARNGSANRAIPKIRQNNGDQRPSRRGKNPVNRPPQVCGSEVLNQLRPHTIGSWALGSALV